MSDFSDLPPSDIEIIKLSVIKLVEFLNSSLDVTPAAQVRKNFIEHHGLFFLAFACLFRSEQR